MHCPSSSVRWAYNYALDWRSKALKEGGERVTRRMTLDKLVELKREEATACEAGSLAL